MNDEQLPRITVKATLQQQLQFLEHLVDPKTREVNGGLVEELQSDAIGTLARYGILIEGKSAVLVSEIDPAVVLRARELLAAEARAFPFGPSEPTNEYGELEFQLDNETIFFRLGLPFAMPFVAVDDGEG